MGEHRLRSNEKSFKALERPSHRTHGRKGVIYFVLTRCKLVPSPQLLSLPNGVSSPLGNGQGSLQALRRTGAWVNCAAAASDTHCCRDLAQHTTAGDSLRLESLQHLSFGKYERDADAFHLVAWSKFRESLCTVSVEVGQ